MAMNSFKKMIMMANQIEPLLPYLYFEALEDDLQVSITKSATQYSLDKVNWIDLPATESTPPIKQGQKIYFKGNAAIANNGIGTFTLTKLCRVGGNPSSLHYGDIFSMYDRSNSLQSLFRGNQNLLEIVNPKTFIPNKTGGQLQQYREMFEGCSNLANAPIIYIKTAGYYALRDMFRGASNINYVVMLAEELSESTPFQTWLYKAASSGTIVLNKNITWNPSEVSGLIPSSKWAVKYCDPDNIDDVKDSKDDFYPQEINTILESVITGEQLDNMDSLLQQISQSQEDMSSINTQLENIINT